MNATKWIEVAGILAENPHIQVICPDCGLAFLRVEDEQLDDEHIDRHLICSNCGARKTMLKRASKTDY